MQGGAGPTPGFRRTALAHRPAGPLGHKVDGRVVSPAFPKSLEEKKNCPGLQASAFPPAEWAEGPSSSGPWDSDLGRDPVA